MDGLTIELRLDADELRSGGRVGSELVVENDSGTPITDRGCGLASWRFALVPADEPDAELWSAVIVDCAGPFTMPDGYREHREGPTFFARTKYGDPLPPGEYVAALELDGRSGRLQEQVVVTDD